jgi:NADPH:quinone reductase-like Zn-dependent oxidoreductase
MIFNFTGLESLGSRNQEAVERAISLINGGIERGIFKPPVNRIFTLGKVVAVHRYMEPGKQIGKIVITA